MRSEPLVSAESRFGDLAFSWYVAVAVTEEAYKEWATAPDLFEADGDDLAIDSLLVCYSPAEVDLCEYDIAARAQSADLWEDPLHQQITLNLHVTEGGRNEHPQMSNIDLFVPIINPGESVILGIGQIADTVVAVNGGIGVRKRMGITLSCDHRVIDGAVAAAFFKTFKERLEDPDSLLR